MPVLRYCAAAPSHSRTRASFDDPHQYSTGVVHVFNVGSTGSIGTMVLVPEIVQMADGLPVLAAGGIAYTVGTVFYMRKSMVYHHAIWHVFVLIGAACHLTAVAFYVIPAGMG